jgi:undecaprenyl-diphosphatase
VEASPFPDVGDGCITDATLVDAWCQLEATHRAGIIHRRVHPRHLLVDVDDHVWLVGWGAGRVDSHAAERDADRAEMAITLASRVGAQRTIDAAVQVLGPAALRGTVAHLQPLALGAVARELTRLDASLLSELRDGIAELDGREAPTPLSPTRVAARNLLPLVGLTVAVYVLLPRLAHSSSTWATLRHADWPWLVGVVGGGIITYLMATVALMAAAGRPLPFGRTFVVQLAAASTNRVVPAGLGAAATNVRYLELAGLERPDAAAAVGITAMTGFGVHTIGTAAAVLALRSRALTLHVPDLNTTWPALLGLALACAAVGWIVWARGLHHHTVRWLRAASHSAGTLISQPGRLALLVATTAGISAGYILALAAALAAFGVQPGLGTVAGVYLASSAVSAIAPIPGGVGPFEAAAVAGLGTLGVAAGPAVAAVLTYRLITYWLPVAPGAVALHLLRRRDML